MKRRGGRSGKIRLAHAVLDMDLGGLQRLITQMTLAMDRDKFDVEIICLNREGCFAERLKAEGIEVTLLQKSQRRADLLYPLRLASHLRRNKTSIVHTHPGTFIFGTLAARLAFIPASVYTEHGRAVVDDPVRQAEDKLAAKLVDRIVPVSQQLYELLIERIKAPVRKMATIINGIDTAEFARRTRPEALLKEFNLTTDCKIIGTVARLDEIKDQLTMIKAFEAVGDRVGDCRLLLVGDGPMRDELNAYIVRQGLQGRVIITGSRGDVPDFLNLFDVFVLSSLSEGTSVSLLEAMASGVSPVVTNVGGNPSIVRHNIDGLVVEPGDPHILAEALVETLTDHDKRHAFSESCIDRVKSEFSMERMTNSYCELYLDILHGKRKFLNVAM